MPSGKVYTVNAHNRRAKFIYRQSTKNDVKERQKKRRLDRNARLKKKKSLKGGKHKATADYYRRQNEKCGDVRPDGIDYNVEVHRGTLRVTPPLNERGGGTKSDLFGRTLKRHKS